MKPSEFEISLSVERYVINAENCRNGYEAEKRIVTIRSKIFVSNFDGTISRFESRFFSKFHVPIFIIFRGISRQREERHDRTESGREINLGYKNKIH